MLRDNQARFVELIRQEHPGASTVTRQQIVAIESKFGEERPHWLLNGQEYRAGRGVYYVPSVSQGGAGLQRAVVPRSQRPVAFLEQTVPVSEPNSIPESGQPLVDATLNAQVAPTMTETTKPVSLVPERFKGYVPF